MTRRIDICDHGERGGECRRCLAPVLDLLESTYRRFVVFDSEHQVVAITLWTAHTHTIEVVDTTPYIHVSSPEKRSGKTRLLEVAGELVLEPVRGASMQRCGPVPSAGRGAAHPAAGRG